MVPDAPGQPPAERLPLWKVFRLRGVPIVLGVIAVWMLAHNTIYTYIAPYLRATGTGITPDLLLFVYGVASLGGVATTGVLLDRHPRALLHGSVGIFVVAALVLLIGHTSPAAAVVATAMWGLGFGGAPAQLQAALTRAGGAHSDVANSFLPVAFNIAIFAAGILGAALLTTFDPLILPVVMIALGAAAFVLTVSGRRSAFSGA
ncbi:putative MFS family arabinose efflux permease [Microbacterium testaceum]|nr:MFS transporter [Microbacterium testaceum]MDQ1173576.1 putative MFS family arabinose efflux permease [Microbacterium testaceum]